MTFKVDVSAFLTPENHSQDDLHHSFEEGNC